MIMIDTPGIIKE